MALNKDFRVKDSLYVSTSGFFADATTSIDTGGAILSAGTNLLDIFSSTDGTVTGVTGGTAITIDNTNPTIPEISVTTDCNTAWNDKLDSAGTIATNDYAKFNSSGNLIGRCYAEVKVDLSLDSVENTAISTWPGSSNITTVGTITTGTWNATDIAVAHGGTGSSTAAGARTNLGLGSIATCDTGDFLATTGGNMTGAIAMGTCKITGLGTPTADADAATKAYVDLNGAGTVCSVTAGNDGIVIGGPVTDPTVSLALSGLTTSTTDADGDFFAVVDSANVQKKLTKANINISGFNNDSNFTDCNGTVCSIATGNGIDGGTITSSGTLTVNAGTGLTQTSTGLCVAAACDSKWSGTYSDLNSLSGTYVTTGSSPNQGTVRLTSTDAPSLDIDTGLQTGDSPTFAGVTGGNVQVGVADNCTITTVSSNLTIDSAGGTVSVADDLCVTGDIDFDGTATGDGSGLTGVTATPTFPAASASNLTSNDKLFINDSATCAVAGNKHITYLNLLTDLAGTGICVDSNDSLCIAGADLFTTDHRIPFYCNNSNTIEPSIITQPGGGTQITIGGDHLVTGDSTIYGNLSVTGDFTCIETTISTTSALSVTNTGTGPALYVKQGGTQPIAHFIDSNGGDIIFADDGKLGIGTFTPAERLTVSGNISACGTLTIDGSTTLGNAGADTTTINGTLIETPNLGTVTGCSLVVRDSGGTIGTDNLTTNNQSLLFGTDNLATVGSSISDTSIPVFDGTDGVLSDSSISDSGSLVTIDSDTKLDAGHNLSIYATGGSVYSRDETFTATVGTGGTTVATFPKSGFRSGKYVVTLIAGGSGVNRTAFEVLVIYNNTTAFGTVYSIIDAQAASQLTSVDVTNTSTTIDLVITSAANSTTAIIQGKALY